MHSITKHKNHTFINAEGTLRFVRLALSCYTPQREGFVLEASHLKRLFQAYLYCNQLWTDECLRVNSSTYQRFRESSRSALIDVSLRLEIPYSEFKYFKDFRTQLYKAIKLFEFAETNDFFKPLLVALDIFDLIDEYLSQCGPKEPNLSSFYTFMMDSHKLAA